MSLTIEFTTAETRRLAALYANLGNSDISGAMAEGEIVTLLGMKLGEEMERKSVGEAAV